MDAALTSNVSDFENTPMGLAQRWGKEIEASRQELSKFHEKAEKIVKRYLDERDDWGKDESRVNLFWSTTKVLLSMPVSYTHLTLPTTSRV